MRSQVLLPSSTAPGGDLPIHGVLASLLEALTDDGAAVLVAPPGSGKTTIVPLALADRLPGRILVAEPRRVAARAAARRMASLTNSSVGDLIGYTVRGDRQVSPATRVEVVTTGVLVQRLQRDQELDGVAAVILDECHERHLDTDLALAFLIDVRANLREDLTVLATSATAQAERIAAALGDGLDAPVPVLAAADFQHPVDLKWEPPARPVAAPHGLRVDPVLLDHVAATVRKGLGDGPGDVLVFLPGSGEIRQVASRLGQLEEVEILTLHGSQSAQVQDAILRPSPRRRVVLASAVAESSLTVPGVRIVVDAGLAREPRTDHARGLNALVTIRVSKASATQRAGRAAREGPGTVYRCWSQVDQEQLPAHPRPEIAIADLTGFVLELARWGSSNGADLTLLDQVPDAAGLIARETLTSLGGLDSQGRITARGEAIARVGAHPRLARALLDGALAVGARRAAEVVGLLAADLRPSSDDLLEELRRLRGGRGEGGRQRADANSWRQETRRLLSVLPRAAAASSGDHLPDELAAALVVGLAYPERLARVRQKDGASYLMTGGTAGELARGSRLTGVAWLAIADADRQPGASTARIRLAAAADESIALAAAATMQLTERQVGWVDGDVRAAQVIKLGAIRLTESPITDADPAEIIAALQEGLRIEGIDLLTFDEGARNLRDRIQFCRHVFGDPWPPVDDQALLDRALLDSAGGWLGPELSKARRRQDLARIDVASALRRLLDWQQAARLDSLAPVRLEVPSGSQVRLDYANPEAPVLAVKVQECFGWTMTPKIADGRVPVLLHLLSPAGRPAAVTSDLASFWRNGYSQVRAELRGRYPKHPWPEDPLSAEPTKRTRPRR